jgi:TM2 domain-containing membrane protein YozV
VKKSHTGHYTKYARLNSIEDGGMDKMEERERKNNRSKVTAALFAIFLGGLGIHKFYLGNPLMGILYIVFCWTFVPAFIGFIEGLIYLSTNDVDFDRKYNY